jgi:hypothetical protein
MIMPLFGASHTAGDALARLLWDEDSQERIASMGHMHDTEGVLGDLQNLPTAFDDRSAELLRSEYDHLAASLLSNEEEGERRVNVLLTLLAAVIAGVGLGADRLTASVDVLFTVLLMSSMILAMYGLVTLRRIIERNITTTDYLNGLRRIRAAFIKTHPEILQALPFVPGKIRQRKREPWWGLGKAGFLEVVAATNCIVLAMGIAGAVWLVWRSWPIAAAAALVVVVATWLGQMSWARYAYANERGKRGKERRDALLAWESELKR